MHVSVCVFVCTNLPMCTRMLLVSGDPCQALSPWASSPPATLVQPRGADGAAGEHKSRLAPDQRAPAQGGGAAPGRRAGGGGHEGAAAADGAGAQSHAGSCKAAVSAARCC